MKCFDNLMITPGSSNYHPNLEAEQTPLGEPTTYIILKTRGNFKGIFSGYRKVLGKKARVPRYIGSASSLGKGQGLMVRIKEADDETVNAC